MRYPSQPSKTINSYLYPHFVAHFLMIMISTRFIDLTQIMETDMPVFPGSKAALLLQESSVENEGYNEIRLQISTHLGTHIDCGYHLIPGGSDTLTTGLDSFYGSGLVVDCHHFPFNGLITREYLQQFEKNLRTSDFVLLHTGWSQYWGLPHYFSGFPVMSEEAATYLASFNLKGIGCDTISFDPVISKSLPVHHILLSTGKILIENLVNLEFLTESGFIFSCFPLRIKNGDGSPVRAVGIIRSDE